MGDVGLSSISVPLVDATWKGALGESALSSVVMPLYDGIRPIPREWDDLHPPASHDHFYV